MLKHLYIRNFVFIDTVELVLDAGVLMISGETGAGKSIILGAIDAALGQRHVHEKIKLGASEAEVILTFELQHNQKAQAFLEEYALRGEESTCIIRRIIYQDGKTRNFINGRPCNITTLRELSELLLLLHTQNENHILLSVLGQTQLVDAHAGVQPLLNKVSQCVIQWKKNDSEIKALLSSREEKNQRLDYLRHQQQELTEAQLDVEEIQALPEKHKALVAAKEAIELYDVILDSFSPQDSLGILERLHRLRQPIMTVEKLTSRREMGEASNELSTLLNHAMIQLQELSSSVKRLMQTIDIDPEKLQQIEARMAELHQLARKHHLPAEALPAQLIAIEQEIETLSINEKKLFCLEKENTTLEKDYQTLATTITQKRTQSSVALSKKVTAVVQELGMPNALFSIMLQPVATLTPNLGGAEQAIFMVKANAAYPAIPLKKTVSGGELARISLALQTILAAYIQIPTLILDEIDVGVGGKIAAMIGQKLRTLGLSHQVICVTHQPQIAAAGHQHLKVEKHEQNQQTLITLAFLDHNQRIDEIARMLGGLTISENARQHAREMLASY